MICILARRGRFLETILQDGARSGVPRTRREPHRREVRTPTARPLRLGAGSRCGSGPTAGSRLRGSASENRHGGAPRGVPVAPGQGGRASQARPKRKSAPVGAPSTPHRGDGIAAVATAAGAKAPWARRRRRKRRHLRRDAQTRAQQRAAGTNNTALFDIVNTTTANGSLRARRDVARVVRAPLSWRAGCKPLAAAGAWFFARHSVRFRRAKYRPTAPPSPPH